METLLQELRFGCRLMFKKPAVTLVAILAIALGIGANTAIFSVVNAVLLRPLPYQDPEELMMLDEKPPTVSRNPVSAGNFLDWRDHNQTFEQMSAFTGQSMNLLGSGGPEQITVLKGSANLFDLLRVSAATGRTFVAGEDQPGRGNVVVLSDALWKSRFGSDANVIGTDVTLDDEKFTVVGVAPPGFRFGGGLDAYVPLVFQPGQINRRFHSLRVIGRLNQGVTLEQAQADMAAIAARISEESPETNKDWGVTIDPLRERIVGDIRPVLLILLGAVGVVLLIACANVANLLLAQASARHREIAIRAALGASRGRLIRQLLIENIPLALLGGGLGLLLALWGVDALVAIDPGNIPRANSIGIDRNVLGFTLGVSLLTAMIFGFAPALEASKLDLNESLKEGGRSSTAGARGRRIRGLLVVSQVALSLVLLVGAGLLIKSFALLLRVEPGCRTENVLTMSLSLPKSRYTNADQLRAFYDRLLQRATSLLGVEAAGLVTSLPLTDWSIGQRFKIDGRQVDDRAVANYQFTSPDYFRAMGIPLLRGRTFTDQDRGESAPVTIINQTIARQFFPDEDPIGKHLSIASLIPGQPKIGPTISREIIGVVGDVKESGLARETSPEVYVSYLQNPLLDTNLVLHSSTDPTSLVAAVRGEVLAIDGNQPVSGVKTMKEVLSESVADRRFNMILLGGFAGVALLLASVGIYGVISYSVSQRTHEFGIRIALGAKPSEVVRLVVKQGMTLALIGVGAGVAAAAVLTRVMSSLLFSVSATDTITFIAIPLLLAGVALVACFVPARRATKVDPIVALRYE